jgi:hypothetical protein
MIHTITAANSYGNGSATISIAVTEVAPSEIVLFATNNDGTGWGSGNLGGRSGADQKCLSKKPSALSSCSNVAAFLSFSSTDQVKDMGTTHSFPTNVPLKAWNGSSIGSQVSTSFSGLFSAATPFDPDLTTAMGLSGVPYMMYGSQSDGTWDSINSCSGFTSDLGTFNLADVDMGNGSLSPEVGSCNSAASGGGDPEYILCLCW